MRILIDFLLNITGVRVFPSGGGFPQVRTTDPTKRSTDSLSNVRNGTLLHNPAPHAEREGYFVAGLNSRMSTKRELGDSGMECDQPASLAAATGSLNSVRRGRVSSSSLEGPRAAVAIDSGPHPGNEHSEGAAFAQFAFHADLAAEQFAQFFDDGEAKARAAVFAGEIIAPGDRGALAEFFEDRFPLAFRNADAGVGNEQFDITAGVAFGANGDPAAFGREFDGVGEQIR